MCYLSPCCITDGAGDKAPASNADSPITEKTWPQANPGFNGKKPAFIKKKSGGAVELDCSNGCDECRGRGICDPAYKA